LAPPGEYNEVQFAAAAAAMRTVAATAVATSLHRRRFLPENARVHPTALLYGERSLYDDDAVRLIAAGSKSRARAGGRDVS